ncbi:MAG: GDP-mannose dehydrogenase [Crocinitomicaceae bacterium]|nr:GDP-mannose dehydrogenase [Crocinitomicaceae bacterium]|tara:strand:+ start:1167 stop:2408 length:1242 start_codon:yes stop_codon:yes gene_type:complete
MKIAVFGLGYVGVVNIACLSELGHELTGVDIKSSKVETVNAGNSPVFEPRVDEMIKNGVDTGKVNATSDAGVAIANSEMAIVCVGTPSDKDGKVNLNFTRNTIREIANELVTKSKKGYCIVLRSTIPPSTIRKLVIPILKEQLGNEYDSYGVRVAFIPEFLREGSAVKDFFEGKRIVVGSADKARVSQIDEVFGFSEKTPLVYVDFDTAEFVKYVDNTFHALKVAFANEVYSIGDAYGVDIKAANDIFLMDDSLNISKRYLRPGAPFGGSCLPKDLRAVQAMANDANEEIPLLNGVVESNRVHKDRFMNRILEFVSKEDKVLIYGMTFKSNTDDTRESPFIEIAERLLDKGYNISIVDPSIKEVDFRINHSGLYNCWLGNSVDNWANFDKYVMFKSIQLDEVDASIDRILNFS